MSSRFIRDPYRAVIQHFNRQRVRYVVIGMSGINYYAKRPSETFATLDYDIFLEPTLENVQQAVLALKRLGFTIGTAGGRLKVQQLQLQEARWSTEGPRVLSTLSGPAGRR